MGGQDTLVGLAAMHPDDDVSIALEVEPPRRGVRRGL